jgi:hypothetical protein
MRGDNSQLLIFSHHMGARLHHASLSGWWLEESPHTPVRLPAGEAESDPQWIAADDAAAEALAVQDDLALKLLETQPTTIAGAAALLTYYVDAVTTAEPEVVFPELDANGRPFESTSIDVPRRDFAYFIIRNVAAALSNMAPAGEGY